MVFNNNNNNNNISNNKLAFKNELQQELIYGNFEKFTYKQFTKDFKIIMELE